MRYFPAPEKWSDKPNEHVKFSYRISELRDIFLLSKKGLKFISFHHSTVEILGFFVEKSVM